MKLHIFIKSVYLNVRVQFECDIELTGFISHKVSYISVWSVDTNYNIYIYCIKIRV